MRRRGGACESALYLLGELREVLARRLRVDLFVLARLPVIAPFDELVGLQPLVSEGLLGAAVEVGLRGTPLGAASSCGRALADLDGKTLS